MQILKSPLFAAQILTGAKSFIDNPVLGSPRLNRMGLHAWRIQTAERMADRRRRALRHLVTDEDAAAFARDGFVARHDLLPPDEFARLRDEVEGREFDACEMKQGDTVTRFISLPPRVLAQVPRLAAVATGPVFQGLLRYVASVAGDPIVYLHTVITDPGKGHPDPQTAFHADTFHATAKCWYFLRDVELEDGPFSYVPGSHRLTPGRLAWEREQSITAAQGPNRLHGRGSFRATAEELEAMGYPPAVKFVVPANTLVVADTHGFHARTPSRRPSVRLGLYGSLRRNPFLPWTGGDVMALPGLRHRKAAAYEAFLDFRHKVLKAHHPQPPVGRVRPGAPAVR